MDLGLRQQLKLAQKLIMTPQLRQAIKLLQLNHLELEGALQAEMEQNPALEEGISQADAPEATTPSLSSTLEAGTTPEHEGDITERVAVSDNIGEVNWEDYANKFDSDFSFAHETPAADAPSQFDFISEKPGLAAHLHWQLAHSELTKDEMEIALYIIGNLNRFGFLELSLEEIIGDCDCDADTAEYVLETIQELDPPGIAARDVGESLLLQLARLDDAPPLCAEIVKNHLLPLANRNYRELMRLTGGKKNEVIEACEFIARELTPYPGLPFSNDTTKYIAPDVYVEKIDGDYYIRLNDDGLPTLAVSGDYRRMLKEGKKLCRDDREYIKENVRSAEWFIKALHQRQRTIHKVMESILKFQFDFFEYGPSHLKPMVLRDVAEDVGMHESTISRVTSNKYAETPQGIFELKYFFSTAIPRQGEEAMAAESIKTRILKMIQEEDKNNPLSDSGISERLAKENIQLARRTVAKYREQMKIMPVKHRKQ
ncbi:MAG: RNA polymerase factor sigma-54 [Desulfobulbaceae bacterium]|jgi:RNA polymerase sigma-54 factor|nr:RNA polymerase factor sigma-54 [Desulfobulbaceae bacterium]